MKLNKDIIIKGFVLAGIMNITGPLFLSRFFTNEIINQADPILMSNFGILQIVIWGLIAIAMSKQYEHLKWLIGVMAIEKFIYGFTWIKWLLNNSLSAVYEQDFMAGIFYTIYGINDWFFFTFFVIVFFKLLKVHRFN